MMPTAQLELPTLDEKRGGAPRQTGWRARLAFFRRPLRLRGNSAVSVPLGVVILFPLIVVLVILILFVLHPSSGVSILIPSGSPPAVR